MQEKDDFLLSCLETDSSGQTSVNTGFVLLISNPFLLCLHRISSSVPPALCHCVTTLFFLFFPTPSLLLLHFFFPCIETAICRQVSVSNMMCLFSQIEFGSASAQLSAELQVIVGGHNVQQYSWVSVPNLTPLVQIQQCVVNHLLDRFLSSKILQLIYINSFNLIIQSLVIGCWDVA